MIRSTVAVLIALCLGPAVAANIDTRLAKFDVCGRYEIFHINSIQTIERDARDNLDQLGIAYGNSHNEHLIAYRLAYNPTQGALLDLVDVFAQKLNEYPGATFAMIVRAFLGRVRDPLPVSLSDELQRILIERIRDTGYVSLNDADLALVVDRIRRQRTSGAKTLLVPHSQGNLYANSAYALLTQAANNPVPTKSLAIVGVASPAAFVAGANGRYVTSRQDLVIFGLRKLLGNGSVLPGNVTQPVTLDDPLGHNFQAIYLRPNTNARTKLLSDMTQLFDSLRTDMPDPIGVGLSALADWTSAVPPPPGFCDFPAVLRWVDGWSQSPDAVFRTVVAIDRSALEPQARANAQACYPKALDIWRQRMLTLGRFDPVPAQLQISCSSYGGGWNPDSAIAAWNAYSGDSHAVTYYESVVGSYQTVASCPDGTRGRFVTYDLVSAAASVVPRCNR